MASSQLIKPMLTCIGCGAQSYMLESKLCQHCHKAMSTLNHLARMCKHDPSYWETVETVVKPFGTGRS